LPENAIFYDPSPANEEEGIEIVKEKEKEKERR
jgi:hypothetical protein